MYPAEKCSWKLMKKAFEFSWKFMKLHERSWMFMKLHDVKLTQASCWTVHDSSWNFMTFFGEIWLNMRYFSWILMNFDEFLVILVKLSPLYSSKVCHFNMKNFHEISWKFTKMTDCDSLCMNTLSDSATPYNKGHRRK